MEKFQKVIEDLIEVFKDLTAIANIKLRAARENKTATIDECMTKEQSLILTIRGLDKKREDIQEEFGFKGLSFKEILEKVSQEEKECLAPLFDVLSREIQMFSSVNDDVNNIISINLREIQKELDKKGNIYGKNQEEKVFEKSLTDRSV